MAKRKKKSFFDSYNYETLSTTTPRCPHFGSCGGCSFQNIAYEDQIKLKEEYLQDLFSKSVPVVAHSSPYEYRNRMDFVYQHGQLGFRKKGDFKTIIPITTCHLVPKGFQESFDFIQKLLSEYKFQEYDFIEHKGFLRYIVFRYAESTNELMLSINTTSPSKEEELLFQEFISKLSATSIYWFVYDDITDVSIPFIEPKSIVGSKTIKEQIGSYTYEISPFTFFQANTKMSQIIFEDIKKEVSGATVDLCCGVGTIGLYVHEKATSITGIEEVEESIDLAKKNMVDNNVSNAVYFASDMKQLLDFTPLDVHTLIVDPPRAGLGKKVIKRIKELDPQKIIYMSCNPKTQKIDMDMLEEYEVVSLKGYDQFPNTPHVETLAILSRKSYE